MEQPDVHIQLPTWDDLSQSGQLQLGAVRRIRPSHPFRLLALLLCIGLTLLVLGLIFVPWVQTVFGTGKVVVYTPGERQQMLTAPVDGQIRAWHVTEGSKVNPGDLLVEISDIDPNIMERLEREREALATKLEAAQRSLSISKINLDRQKTLWEQGLSARRAVEVADLEYAKFLGEISSASAELARTETKLARQASQSITATSAGILQKILVPQGGELVKQGDTIAVIVPDSTDQAVELFISGNDIPLLSVGREVRLQFEGWPAVQFSGWPSVAVGTFTGNVAVVDPSDDGLGKFRIVVFPAKGETSASWPEPRYLRQGVRVVGWVLLDKVPLGWELWRRFNAFPLTVPKDVKLKPIRIKS